MGVISSAIEFIEKLRDDNPATIKFIKKDGSERIMKCTLNFNKIPDSDKPKGVSLKAILNLIRKHKLVHVYDLEKRLWRSVPFDRIEWVTIDNRRFTISNKGGL